MMVSNAKNQINNQDPNNPKEGDYNIFNISEVLALLTCKTKEDVMSDILNAT